MEDRRARSAEVYILLWIYNRTHYYYYYYYAGALAAGTRPCSAQLLYTLARRHTHSRESLLLLARCSARAPQPHGEDFAAKPWRARASVLRLGRRRRRRPTAAAARSIPRKGGIYCVTPRAYENRTGGQTNAVRTM